MRKENSDFKTKFISEPGSYLQNRDYFAFVELEDCACYCIADGIDEDPRKESAKLAVSAAIEAFHENPRFSKRAIKRYLSLAHEELQRESTEARLEASMVIVLTNYKKVIWAYAGNSRMYIIRNENIKYQTMDHSLSQNLANEGEIPIDQIDFHDERHNLYRYVGQPGRLIPTVSKSKKLEDGDIIILCTRGMWQGIGTAELLDALEGTDNPENVCTGLEDVILSQQNDIIDNYTIATIFINKVYRNPKANRNKKIMKIATTVLLALLMITLTLTIVFYNKNKSNYNSMLTSKNKGIELIKDREYEDAKKEMMKAVDSSLKIKTSKNSKKAIQIQMVKEYAELSKMLSSGMEYLNNEFYSNAQEKFKEALEAYNVLKGKYNEDFDIDDVINAYENYSKYMNEANAYIEQGEYEQAAESFEDARKSGMKAGDMEAQTKSESKKNEALALNFSSIGDQYMKEANKHFDLGEYTGALTDYQASLNAYNTAAELSKDVELTKRLESAELGIANASAAINNQSVKEKEAEAKKHIEAGDKKYKNQKYEEAIVSYENAKTIYSDTNNSAMLSIVDSYIEKAQKQIDAAEEEKNKEAEEKAAKDDKAATYLLSASELFAEGEYQKAIDHYSLAMDLYKELDKNEEAKTLQRIIKSIKEIQKEKNNP